MLVECTVKHTMQRVVEHSVSDVLAAPVAELVDVVDPKISHP